MRENDLLIDKNIDILKENNNVKILFNSNYDFCVYNLTSFSGQILLTGRKENIIPGYFESFSLEGFSEGIYFLQILNDERTITKILMKVH